MTGWGEEKLFPAPRSPQSLLLLVTPGQARPTPWDATQAAVGVRVRVCPDSLYSPFPFLLQRNCIASRLRVDPGFLQACPALRWATSVITYVISLESAGWQEVSWAALGLGGSGSVPRVSCPPPGTGRLTPACPSRGKAELTECKLYRARVFSGLCQLPIW